MRVKGCKDCGRRKIGCHIDCKDYKDYLDYDKKQKEYTRKKSEFDARFSR